VTKYILNDLKSREKFNLLSSKPNEKGEIKLIYTGQPFE